MPVVKSLCNGFSKPFINTSTKFLHVLSTDLAQGFVRDFSEPNEGTERTWLQLIRSCALHLLQCPNFKKAKGVRGRVGTNREPEGKGRQKCKLEI